MIPKSEVDAAYLTLNIADSSISDEAVLQQYQLLVRPTSHLLIDAYILQFQMAPGSLDEFRASLRLIAESRNSVLIEHFLNTGEMPGGGEMDLSVIPTLETDVTNITQPAGLNNIGNTCYLNSLLQVCLYSNKLSKN